MKRFNGEQVHYVIFHGGGKDEGPGPDADEIFPHAVGKVAPEVLEDALPGYLKAEFGCLKHDVPGYTKPNGDFIPLTGDPEEMGLCFVGCGKGRYDEHQRYATEESAATLVCADLELSMDMQLAIAKSLGDIVHEEKQGFSLLHNAVPALTKKMHRSGLFSTAEVIEWCALAYAAEIKEGLKHVKDGTWSEWRKTEPLNIRTAPVLIEKHYDAEEAKRWLEMANRAVQNTNKVLKKEAREVIIPNAIDQKGKGGIGRREVLDSKIGQFLMLIVKTDNPVVAEIAMLEFDFPVVIVQSEKGNVMVQMDRREHWCACEVAANLRNAENKKRKRDPITRLEAYAMGSTLACREFHLANDFPTVFNGSLKHPDVPATALDLKTEVVPAVLNGLNSRFRCKHWESHPWLKPKESKAVQERKKEKDAEVQQEKEKDALLRMEEQDGLLKLFADATKRLAEETTTVTS